jgi:taurine dioxygenase
LAGGGKGADKLAHFAVEQLATELPFGAIVKGLDPRSLLQEEVRQALRDLWTDRGLIVFRDLEGEDVQLDLSRCFGTLIPHPLKESRSEHHPELFSLLYEPKTGWLMNVNGERRGAYLPWHSDLIYVDKVNRGGIMRVTLCPSRLGETGYIDKIAAYSDLPRGLQQRADKLEVIYKYNLDPEKQKFGRTHDVHVERFSAQVASVQARLHEFPRVIHPMVYTQKETGKKVLNISPWFADGIVGMENPEGDALLDEIIKHIVNTDRVYMHHWSPSDMVLFDNWRMLHSATGCPADETRWMIRTTIQGDYGLGRAEGDAVNSSRYISV